jgi:hypothetical protein
MLDPQEICVFACAAHSSKTRKNEKFIHNYWSIESRLRDDVIVCWYTLHVHLVFWLESLYFRFENLKNNTHGEKRKRRNELQYEYATMQQVMAFNCVLISCKWNNVRYENKKKNCKLQWMKFFIHITEIFFNCNEQISIAIYKIQKGKEPNTHMHTHTHTHLGLNVTLNLFFISFFLIRSCVIHYNFRHIFYIYTFLLIHAQGPTVDVDLSCSQKKFVQRLNAENSRRRRWSFRCWIFQLVCLCLQRFEIFLFNIFFYPFFFDCRFSMMMLVAEINE